MQNIIIGRYDADPEAQGIIKPEDGRWQLILDKDGYPHLYVQVNVQEKDGKIRKAMFCLEDLTGDLHVRELMNDGYFGGELSPEEEAEAAKEHEERRKVQKIPDPRY